MKDEGLFILLFELKSYLRVTSLLYSAQPAVYQIDSNR